MPMAQRHPSSLRAVLQIRTDLIPDHVACLVSTFWCVCSLALGRSAGTLEQTSASTHSRPPALSAGGGLPRRSCGTVDELCIVNTWSVY